MAFFEYQAKDIEGKIINDTIEADDQAAALAILSNKGYLITSINDFGIIEIMSISFIIVGTGVICCGFRKRNKK